MSLQITTNGSKSNMHCKLMHHSKLSHNGFYLVEIESNLHNKKKKKIENE